MSYYNPLRQRGDATVAAELADAGGDAVIVPDLPAEEDRPCGEALAARQLGLVPLLAPTSTDATYRRRRGARPAAFIYCVALVGVTGARAGLSDTLGDVSGSRRAGRPARRWSSASASLDPEHVRSARELGASGAIVASALVDLVDTAPEPLDAARAYVATMRAAGQSEVRAGA